MKSSTRKRRSRPGRRRSPRMRGTWNSSPQRRPQEGLDSSPKPPTTAPSRSSVGLHAALGLTLGLICAAALWALQDAGSLPSSDNEHSVRSLHPCVRGVPAAQPPSRRAAVSGLGPMTRTYPGAALKSHGLRSNIQRIIVQLQVTNLEPQKFILHMPQLNATSTSAQRHAGSLGHTARARGILRAADTSIGGIFFRPRIDQLSVSRRDAQPAMSCAHASLPLPLAMSQT